MSGNVGEWEGKDGKEIDVKASRSRKNKCRSGEEEGGISLE